MLPTTTACAFSTAQRPKILQSWVLLTFWLGNLLRATAACNFLYLIWPDGSAPAALTSLLFDPPEPQNIRKTECFAAFTWTFFLLTLSLLTLSHLWLLSSLLFHLSILSEVWLLNFLRSDIHSYVYIYTFTHIRSSPFAHRYLSCQLDQIDVCKVSGMYPILNPQLGIVYFLNP